MSCPTIGLTIYGGAGDDTIYGSQAGDHLAGGSGDDTIYGQRGVDHIYGDSGFNVNILDRALVVSTTNAAPRPTFTGVGFDPEDADIVFDPLHTAPDSVIDQLDPGRDTLSGNGPGTVLGGPDTAYIDVIFGDHGQVLQDVVDPEPARSAPPEDPDDLARHDPEHLLCRDAGWRRRHPVRQPGCRRHDRWRRQRHARRPRGR